jgi:YD repeat-containing protein
MARGTAATAIYDYVYDLWGRRIARLLARVKVSGA